MLLKLDENSISATCVLGVVAEGRGLPPRAETAYRRAIELAIDDPRGGVLLHGLLLAEGSDAEAGELRARLAARFPRLSETILELGAHLAATGRWREAASAFDEALAMRPGDADAATGGALGSVMSGDPAGVFELSGRLPPHARANNPSLQLLLVSAHLQAGDCASALRELDAAGKRLLDSAPVLVLRGEILCRMSHFDAAMADFERALALAPATARAHRGLGRVHLQQRRYHAAVRSLQQAVQIEPGDGGGHALLAAALAATGDLATARRHRGIALSRDGSVALVERLDRLFPALTRSPTQEQRPLQEESR
jgi:tetratricopeptide (TPR) repeat protein